MPWWPSNKTMIYHSELNYGIIPCLNIFIYFWDLLYLYLQALKYRSVTEIRPKGNWGSGTVRGWLKHMAICSILILKMYLRPILKDTGHLTDGLLADILRPQAYRYLLYIYIFIIYIYRFFKFLCKAAENRWNLNTFKHRTINFY